MAIEIPIHVNYQTVKDAGKEAGKLRQELVDLGGMDVPVNLRVDTAGWRAAAEKYSKIIQESIDRVIKGPSRGGITIGPDGRRLYTSPEGVQYGMGGGSGAGSSIPSDGDRFGIGNIIKRYLGPAAAGYYLWNELKQEHRDAKQFEREQMPLRLRGVKISDYQLQDAAKFYGMSPTEYASVYGQLGAAGLSSRSLNPSKVNGSFGYSSESNKFVTAIGGLGIQTSLGAEQVANFFTKSLKLTDSKDSKAFDALNGAASHLLKSSQRLGIWGRLGETYQAHSSIMEQLAATRGGSEVSAKEIMAMTSMQQIMMGMGKVGQGQNSANLFSGLNAGITAGGSDPGSQMLFAKAMGIGSVNSLEDLWEYEMRKSRGATPDNILRVLQTIDGQNPLGGKEGLANKRHTLLRLFPQLKAPQINALTATNGAGYSFQKLLAKVVSGEAISIKDLQSSSEYREALAESGLTGEELNDVLGLQDKTQDAKQQALNATGLGRTALKATVMGKGIKNSVKDTLFSGIKNQMTGDAKVRFGGQPDDLREWSPDKLDELKHYYQIKGGRKDIVDSINKIQGSRFTEGVDQSYYPNGGEIRANRDGETLDKFVGSLGSMFDKFLEGLHKWTEAMYQQKTMERTKATP